MIYVISVQENKMKAISIKEPWASMIAYGYKTIETRNWNTNYRGEILICSSKIPVTENSGKALAIANIVDCRFMLPGDEQAAKVPVHPFRYSWVLENIRPLKRPLDVKGKLRIFEVNLTEIEMQTA